MDEHHERLDDETQFKRISKNEKIRAKNILSWQKKFTKIGLQKIMKLANLDEQPTEPVEVKDDEIDVELYPELGKIFEN